MPESFVIALSILAGILLLAAILARKPKKQKALESVSHTPNWTPVVVQETPSAPARLVHADPVQFHTMHTGVSLPLAWTFISAALAALAVSGIALLFGAEWPLAGKLFLGMFMAGLCAGWALFWNVVRGDWLRTLQRIEPLLGKDLDGDGRVGPAKLVQARIVHETDGQFTGRKTINLPASPEQIKRLAHGVIDLKMTLAERNWTGKGRPFSLNEFRKLRYVMVSRGLATGSDKGTNQGFSLTDDGMIVLEEVLNG